MCPLPAEPTSAANDYRNFRSGRSSDQRGSEHAAVGCRREVLPSGQGKGVSAGMNIVGGRLPSPRCGEGLERMCSEGRLSLRSTQGGLMFEVLSSFALALSVVHS